MARNTVEQTPAARLLAQVESDERLAEAATPGPWEHEENEVLWKLMGSIGDGTFHGLQIAKCPKRGTPYAEYWPAIDDANFIAASRSIVPRQAAQMRVLVEALALIRKHARHPDKMSDGTHVDPMTTLAAIYAHSGRALEVAAAMMSGDDDDAA